MSNSCSNTWKTLIDVPDEAGDLKQRSDYLILIWAGLNGQSGKVEDKAEWLGLSAEQIQDLMKGDVQKFSLNELVVIAKPK
jgi:predicted XRE-type DNA-binding protein